MGVDLYIYSVLVDEGLRRYSSRGHGGSVSREVLGDRGGPSEFGQSPAGIQ